MEDPIPPTQEREELVTRRVGRSWPAAYFTWVRLVWFVAWVVGVLCALRFLLRLLGASTASPFVSLEYALSDPLVAPFRGIFPESGAGRYVWEPSALVAIVVYALIAVGLAALIRIVASPRRRPPVGIE
jgi:uncharacterized protein YggT (Ycf19 family)